MGSAKWNELLIVENGVDFRNGYHGRHDSKSIAYEDFCFHTILDKLEPNNFAIGPHFIDNIFGISSADLARPDAIIFDVKNSEQWKIKHLYEFKSGKGNGIVNKLDGFSKFLTHLREHKYFLPSLLKENLGEDMKIPSEIIVLPDEQVLVTIMKPKSIEAYVLYSNVKFPVEYSVINPFSPKLGRSRPF